VGVFAKKRVVIIYGDSTLVVNVGIGNREDPNDGARFQERSELVFVRNGWGDLRQGPAKRRGLSPLSPLGPLSVSWNVRG
jgi:hypothetical protein